MFFKPKVSIIVPFYNTSKYFNELMDRLLGQSYKNIEVLLINDGSTDNSLDLALKYEKKDKRVQVFSEKNSGPGKARNIGLDNATGKYYLFVDSDDLLEYNAVEILINTAKKYKADMVNFNAGVFYDGVKKENTIIEEDRYIKKHDYSKIYEGCEYFDLQMRQGDPSIVVWSYLFSAKIAKETRFLGTRCHDDNLYTCENFVKTKRLKFISDKLYYRRVRQDSIMTKKGNIEDAYSYYKIYLGFNKIKDAHPIMKAFMDNKFKDTQMSLDRIEKDVLIKEYDNDYEEEFKVLIKESIDKR